ncbi:MAG: Tat-translocated enzyme [Actinomycetia bacterium]|nr:Tat-translocated enzyme [Actinomycetes bacterium]
MSHSTLIAAAAGGFVAAFAGDNVIQLGCWAVAAAGFFLLAQRKTSGVWVATGAAALIAVASGVTDMPTLWRSSAPLSGPLWLERLLVVTTVGIGFGLVLALPLWLRAERFKAAQLPGEPAADELAATQPGERVSRRGVLTAGGLAGLGGLGAGAALTSGSGPTPRTNPAPVPLGRTAVPFHGQHQAGIITPARPQARTWIAAFDLAPHADRAALTALLRRWTDAAAQLTQALPYGTDDLIAAGSGAASLTVTVSVGPSLFGKAGLPLSARPTALTPLPAFPGEHLDPARSDGDLGVLICADDALVVFHAAHTLQRLTGGTAVLRWQMSGFGRTPGAGADDTATARNLMGQLDGTNNPKPADPAFTGHVFATGPTWMNGGSYLVIRRIRMLLDRWDTLPVTTQEQVIGRRKDNGAPLSGGTEFTPANYGQTSPGGHPTIPVHAHKAQFRAGFLFHPSLVLDSMFEEVKGADLRKGR